MPSAKGFDFFVESSFVEVYNEQCRDLYSKGGAVASSLPVSGLCICRCRGACESRFDVLLVCCTADVWVVVVCK